VISLFRSVPALTFMIGCLRAQSTSLVLSPAPVVSGGALSLDVSLESPANVPAASLQWQFKFSSPSSVSLEPGPAAASAGKALICAGRAPVYTCLVVGSNSTTIPNGVVARVRAALPSNTAGGNIQLTDALGASPSGDPIAIFAAPGVSTDDSVPRRYRPGRGRPR